MRYIIRFLTVAVLTSLAQAELIATFSQQGEPTDKRLDRLVALSVPAGQVATPFLKPGKFDAEWSGSLKIDQRRRLIFSFEGQGEKVELTINGEVVLAEAGKFGAAKSKRLRLNPGVHTLSVKFQSADDGAGEIRLYWEEESMPRQTIPPTAYDVTADEPATAGDMKRHGRKVFAEQNCVKCHAPESGFGAAPMPELLEIAPILAGIGDRVTEEWLMKWIADPKAMRPSTKMPHMVDPSTPQGLQQAADLAAYLVSTATKKELKPSTPDPTLVKAGGVVFHELGCVACHDPAGEKTGDDSNRIPLNNVASKYLPDQLMAFLKKPEAFHPYTSMPNFQLSDDEVKSLAAFLEADSSGKETKLNHTFPKGDATRGAAISESLQCGTCHPGMPGGVSKVVSLEGIFKIDWAQKGCVSIEKKQEKLPKPNLSPKQLEALLSFSKSGHSSLTKDSHAEFANRQIDAKRCTSCHALDEQPALLSSIHNSTAKLAAHIKGLDERVDQSRPQLTFIGEMLHTSYIEAMLTGTVKERARPWLGMRMPAFNAYAKPFAEGLSRLHGFSPSTPEKMKTDPELVKIGHSLIGAEGFGCTTCHGDGENKPTAAFEVGAVNFAQVSERLREGYYYRWMDHPAAVMPGNKMPRYAEGNQSKLQNVLEGDASKQYEAIWNWIQEK
jgi:mono/diheme cytochrome c family protein